MAGVLFYETKLFVAAQKARDHASWALPDSWKTDNKWMNGEIRAIAKSYTGYPDFPPVPEELTNLTDSQRFNLASKVVEFVVSVFNNSPGAKHTS